MTSRDQRDHPTVLCFATQGADSGDERRIRTLLEPLDPIVWPFDRAAKARSGWKLFQELAARRPDLVVMEGTGIAGGIAVIAARLIARIPYVISSGDAVGPYVRLTHRRAAPLAAVYERVLCRLGAGFIGWSPYLAGRALTLGAPRAMTAANWAAQAGPEDRAARRDELGIPAGATVFGLVGSLEWTATAGYCYGLELVRAIRAVSNPDARVLVLGDGSGLSRLKTIAGEELGKRVILPGHVASDEVPSYLSAIDVASLPQSVDGVGSFRYTTKISEYLAAGLPIVTGQIPLAYDLDDGWIWRLPGDAPWDPTYISALAELMETITPGEIARRSELVPRSHPLFDLGRQQRQVSAFVWDLLNDRSRA